MFKSKKINIASAILTLAALIIGLVALVWNIILETHHWNHQFFRENHYTDGIIGGLSITLISLVVFWICSYFLKRNLKNKA